MLWPLLVLSVGAGAPSSPVSDAREARLSALPLRRLILYENGVGYFERRGSVLAGQVAEIPLEAGQLDDALKSLVVISSRGVASVEFAPPLAPEAARAMAGLPTVGEQRSLFALLRALQGVEVQVVGTDGSTARGRVMEVSDDEKRLDHDGKPVDDPVLMVFGPAGLSKTPLRLISSVRPTEASVSQAWSRATATLALQPKPERLVVRGSAGAGDVAVGYTTESAVWRTTYRLVMGRAGARLQGFALVHNDSDEAWHGVNVSLASGRPTSFLFPLAGPRYGRRDLLAPDDGLETAPQLATRQAQEHLRGMAENGGTMLSLHGSGSGAGGVAYGAGGLGLAASASLGGGTASILEDGPTPLEPAAVSEAGDLFLYTVKEPVELGARRSALLPIIDAPTKAERVTVVDPSGQLFSGIRLENSTKVTFEGGTLAVFTDGAYGGETQIDRIKPGEVRVVKHGLDLDVEVTRSLDRHEGALRHAFVDPAREALVVNRVDTLTHRLSLHSRTEAERTLLVELPEARFRVSGGGEEDVRSPGQPRYGRVTLAPRAEAEVALAEEGTVELRLPLKSLAASQVAGLAAHAGASLAAAEKARLEQLAGDLARAEASDGEAAKWATKLEVISQDITRVRDDLAAVGKSNVEIAAAKELGERLLRLEDARLKAREAHDAATDRSASIRKSVVAGVAYSTR